MTRPFWPVLLTLLISLLGGCNQLLMGGLVAGQALAPISETQEIQIGRSAAEEVLKDPKTPAYVNTQVTQYVTELGKKVAAHCERPQLPYEFHVVSSDELNAFALPGGQIFITTAALKSMKSEAELTGVLGHEIAHTARSHGIDRLRKAMVAQGLLVAAFGSTPALVQQAGKLALQVVLNGFTRTLEDEADWYGVLYSNSAGYDPHGLSDFLNTLFQKLGDTPKAFEAFGDHPSISERLNHIATEISSLHLLGSTSNSQTYLNQTQPLR